MGHRPGYFKEYAAAHREQHKKHYEEHKEQVLTRNKYNKLRYREAWIEYFKSIGYDKCSICGYNKSFAAIDFHHVNPEEKERVIGHFINCNKVTEELKREVLKCVPLCANCHRELHMGVNNGSN